MKSKILAILLVCLLAYSCKKDDSSDVKITKDLFTGYVQKGPFINGSSITIAELTTDLSQTGRLYSTTIADNSGKFEQKNIELSSQFVSIKADGFYFNENDGKISSAQLTLTALSDITDVSSVNVNILTHLEKSRIEYLVGQKGYTFQAAKAQALKDVLAVFSIEKSDIGDPETFNLTQDSDDDAILLAVSAIIQGYRNTSEMSELIADIITDIREDGQLNSSTLGSKLINDAQLLDLSAIRQNMENRYQDLGVSITLPSFEKYVKVFVDNTTYQRTKLIEYPATSNFGINILNENVNSATLYHPSGETYSMAANLPIGTHLKIVLQGGSWQYQMLPNGPVNWTITKYSNEQQSFTATESGKSCDVNIEFMEPDTLSILYYENNSESPTKIKTLIIK